MSLYRKNQDTDLVRKGVLAQISLGKKRSITGSLLLGIPHTDYQGYLEITWTTNKFINVRKNINFVFIFYQKCLSLNFNAQMYEF